MKDKASLFITVIIVLCVIKFSMIGQKAKRFDSLSSNNRELGGGDELYLGLSDMYSKTLIGTEWTGKFSSFPVDNHYQELQFLDNATGTRRIFVKEGRDWCLIQQNIGWYITEESYFPRSTKASLMISVYGESHRKNCEVDYPLSNYETIYLKIILKNRSLHLDGFEKKDQGY